MGFVGQMLIMLGTSSIWGFLLLPSDVLLGVTYANMLVATQQSGRSLKVVAFFPATNFSSYIIELLQQQDEIQI